MILEIEASSSLAKTIRDTGCLEIRAGNSKFKFYNHHISEADGRFVVHAELKPYVPEEPKVPEEHQPELFDLPEPWRDE